MKKIFKTFLTMILIVALTANIAPLSYAEGENDNTETENWSEIIVAADTSYTTSGSGEFASQAESIYTNVYHVKTAEQLATALSINYTRPKIILDNDIDMLGSEGRVWDLYIYFTGILDGQNHTISGLMFGDECNFINTLNDMAVIENVNFEFVKSDNLQSLVYSNFGLITNVNVNIAKDSSYKGGSKKAVLAQTNYSSISNCSVNGEFNAEVSGGFACIAYENKGSITDCIFNGSIKSVNNVNSTYAMVGACNGGSRVERLICNSDVQGCQLSDIIKAPSLGDESIDYNTIYYPEGLSLTNTNSNCKSTDNVAKIVDDNAFDFANIYKFDSKTTLFSFEMDYLKSFNNQLSTTDSLTLSINGDNYNAKIYKNIKSIVFEVPLIIDTSDVNAEYKITGKLDGNDIALEKRQADIYSYGIWDCITLVENNSQIKYSVSYETKAGKTYFVDLDFSNIIKNLGIEGPILDKDNKTRVAFSFAKDPSEITASNMVLRWFSDNLEIKKNDTLLLPSLQNYNYVYTIDLTYNGKDYPAAIILSVPDNKKADWNAKLGAVPKWALKLAEDEYLENHENRDDITDDKIIRYKYNSVPPTSYVDFSSNHDAIKIKNNIDSGNLIEGLFDGVVSGYNGLSYHLNPVYYSTSLDDEKCTVSYNTSTELVCFDKSNLYSWELETVESIQSNANIKATTTISTDFVDSSYNVKVKSNTKGRTADETYEYVVESVSLDGAGNETRKIDIQRKLSSSDTSGLLGSVKVGYADLLDKKTNKFKDKNTVRYYVRQISGSDKDITYDKSEYMIEILVKLEDEDRKKVAADVKVYKDGVLTSLTPDKLSFENVYNAPAADVTTDHPKESTDQPKESTGKESVSSLKKPSSLKIIAKKKTLIVSWNKVKGAVSYQIQVSKKKSFKSAKTYIKKLKAGNKSKNISYKCDKLKKKTKYYVRVRAVDSKGNIGPWSKTLNKKTK